jgi:tetratricopeptide (TPR) repeat protein
VSGARTGVPPCLLLVAALAAGGCRKAEAPGSAASGGSAAAAAQAPADLKWDEGVPRLIRNGPLSRLELADLIVRSIEETGKDRIDDVEALLADDAKHDARAAILMGRARTVGMSADLHQARTWFDLAELNGGDPAEVAAGRAVLAQLAGNPDQAMKLLAQVPSTHRDSAHLEAVLGQLLREAGRLDEAEKRLVHAASAAPTEGEPEFQLALIAEERGDAEAYAKALDETIRRDPGHPGARLARARLRQHDANPDAAKDAEIHRLLIRNGELKRRPPDDEAAGLERIANAKQLVEMEPDVPAWRGQLIEALVARRRNPEALDVIRQAEAITKDPVDLARFARLAYELDDLALAERMAQHALAGLPASAAGSSKPRTAAAATLGACLLRAGRGPEALASLEVAATLAPEQADVRTLYAHALRAAGQNEAALREYWAAYQINPENAHALAGLAALLQEAGRSDEAQEALAEATRLAPDEPAVEASRTVVLAGRGDAEGAIIAAQRASHLAPEDRVLHYQAGFLLLQAGRAAEAVAELEKATSADGTGMAPGNATRLLEQARQAAAAKKP